MITERFGQCNPTQKKVATRVWPLGDAPMMGGYVKTFFISNPHTLGQSIRLDGVKTLVSVEVRCAISVIGQACPLAMPIATANAQHGWF